MNILSAVIATTTAVIVVLQYGLARLRWRLDLYDKRYPVFADTMGYIASIVRSAAVTLDQTSQFLRETMAKDFLFGHEVHDFLKSLYDKGVDLWTAQQVINGKTRADEISREARVHEAAAIQKWFGDQLGVAKTVFEPYLRIKRK